MPALRPPASLKTQTEPPARVFPQIDNLKLPRPLTQAVTQAFQVAYSVGDQAASNATNLARTNNYGTWNARLNADAVAYPDGALWHVTDLPNALYQVRMDPKSNQLQWFYDTGIVSLQGGKTATTATGFTFTPTVGAAIDYALGINDAGFMLLIGGAIHVWDGSKWTN